MEKTYLESGVGKFRFRASSISRERTLVSGKLIFGELNMYEVGRVDEWEGRMLNREDHRGVARKGPTLPERLSLWWGLFGDGKCSGS